MPTGLKTENKPSTFLIYSVFIHGLLKRNAYYREHFPRSQVLFTLLLTLHYVAFLFLRLFYLHNGAIYIYMILAAILTIVTYPISLVILLLERRRQLPSIPARGHGVVLLLFWTLAFANENLGESM